jgi:hypothetical protein
MMGDSMFLETANPDTDLFGRSTEARRNKFLIVVNDMNRKNLATSNDMINMIISKSFMG